MVTIKMFLFSVTPPPPPLHFPSATTTKHIKDFIRAVESIEAVNPGFHMLDVVKGLCKAAGFETNLIKSYLGDLSDAHVMTT